MVGPRKNNDDVKSVLSEGVFNPLFWRGRNSSDIISDVEIDHTPILDAAYSFEHGIERHQFLVFRGCGLAVSLALLLMPSLALWFLSGLLIAIFSILIMWRLGLVLVGVLLRFHPRQQYKLPKGPLPKYSILVPLYQEATIIPQLAQALKKLDWPKAKLDIQLLIEADDVETQKAAQKARFSKQTRVTLIPPGGPRTKPNALNYGLARATGKFVCVYDAEDRPDPAQLKKAYVAFERGDLSLACVQAPLVSDNGNDALIAAHWSLEYAVQFGLLMPALTRFHLPLLIGGTSNHFRKSALFAAGGWDAWNVTEDADLGMRFARGGLKVQMIAPSTLEDAPTETPVWVAQRSRWIKGFMQSWLVLMRRPSLTLRQMGWVDFSAMQLCLGGAILAPLLHLPFFLMVVLSLGHGTFSLGMAGWSLLIAGLTIGAVGDIVAPGSWTRGRVLAVLTRPLYWPLHSIAAYRALWELAARPFFWAKTPHQPRQKDPNISCSIGSSA